MYSLPRVVSDKVALLDFYTQDGVLQWDQAALCKCACGEK